MQISSTPTAYGGGEAQRLLNMILQPQPASAGQDLPSTDATGTASTSTTQMAGQLSGGPSATQFVSNTLASLLSAQEAPTSASSIASQIMSVADTNGDGSLSLSEVENALGMSTASGTDSTSGANSASGTDSSSGADALAQAFAQIDTNGDGEISQQELTNALAAQNGSQGAQGAQGVHGAHHGGHHHHGASGASGADSTSSTDLASQLLGAADSNQDGSLSLTEVESALGVSAGSSDATSLSTAFNSLDTNGDGQLSASEISAGIDAFRQAHHMGGAESVQAQSPQFAQAVSA
jgi:Ca2+-binding EF-hand superfamily protein